MAGIAIGIGSIALAIATDGVSLALEAAIAGISVSALGTALGFIQWGSSNSWDVTSGIHFWNTVDQPIQFYLDTSLIPFQVSTAGGNVNVTVNIANAFVYGQTPPSSGGGGGCVLNGTIVSLANGTTVLIQNLRPGMKTVSYDPITHRLFTSTVDSVNETNVTMIMDINHGSLYVSGMNDQPIFVKLKNGTEEWLTLDQLNYGMELFNPQKHTWTLITSISLQFGNFSVYDVQTVPNIHDQGHLRGDYIANGFLLDKKIG